MILSKSLVVQYYDLFIIVHHNNSYLFLIFYLCSVSSGGTRGGARGACPPYFLTKMRLKGPKKIFCRLPPRLSQGLDGRAFPYLKVQIHH